MDDNKTQWEDVATPKKEGGTWKLSLAITATVVVLSTLIGVSVGQYDASDEGTQGETLAVVTEMATDELIPQSPSIPERTGTSSPTSTSTPNTEETAIVEVSLPLYDFTQPAPEGDMVDMDWFADAVFIGDSRTEGLSLYGGITGSTFLCCKGISIFDVVEDPDKKVIFSQGNYYTVLEALALGTYTKVYISLGINELGYYNDQNYEDAFVELITQVRAIQPDAVIYIQTLVPVNPDRALERGQPDYVNNDRIADYNAILRKITSEEQVVLLETAIALADEDGILPYDASTDGVHFVRAWYELWRDYLMTHPVESHLYFRSITQ